VSGVVVYFDGKHGSGEIQNVKTEILMLKEIHAAQRIVKNVAK
jgi:hypothetical protein